MSKEFTISQLKELNRLAVNTPNLKDYGEAAKINGRVIDGYFQLKDNRIIKIKDLYPAQLQETEENKELIEIAEENPQLRNLVGLGTDKNGLIKNGFLLLPDGKVVSKKQVLKLKH